MLATCSLALFMAGCTPSPPVSTVNPELTYSHLEGVRMDVVEIQVQDDYRPPYRHPYVDHMFPTQPRDAIKTMLGKRLKPAGDVNTMRLILQDASVIEEPIQGIGGVQGAFTKEPDVRYRANVKMIIEFLNPDGIRIGGARLHGERTTEAFEGISLAAREKLWLSMTEKLVSDLDQEMVRIIHEQLASFLDGEQQASHQDMNPAL